MAARTNRPNHTDKCREQIRTSQLLNRLHDHVFTEDVEKAGKLVPAISQTQMKAIEILLKKSLGDVSSIELTGKDGGPVETSNVGLSETHALLGAVAASGSKEPLPEPLPD